METEERLPNIHPGDILRLDFLEPMGIAAERLAQEISLPPEHVREMLRGGRAVTADAALRLGRFFGMDPRFWMNLQARYDLEEALLRNSDAYAHITISERAIAA